METQTLVKEICPTTTQEWVKRGALLVDVREADEVAELAYDVHNVVNIPLSEFENRYTELPKEREMVIVCKGGSRSLRAAGFLINHGYDRDKVVNMQHGIIRWAQKGFPTKGDTSSASNSSTSGSCCATITLQNETSSNNSSDNSGSSRC